MRRGCPLARVVQATGVFAVLAGGPAARAQVNLPPPPPPPITQQNELPPPPPAPPSTQPQAPQRSAPPPPPRYAPPPPPRAPVARREEVVVFEEPEARPLSITFNPVPLFLGRLSANVEVLLAPHHALVVSPNVLVLDADRGTRTLWSDGLGFASPTSASVGVEVGYHYWTRWGRAARGIFLGPSILVGATGNADVGNGAVTQGYYGFAFDVGRQLVFPGGFTIGSGLGVGVLRMADAVAVFPRLLLQIGWSF